MFRACLVRSPRDDERALLVKFYDAQRKRFATDPDRADAVGGPGNNGPAAERAAWAAFAQALFSAAEFRYLD